MTPASERPGPRLASPRTASALAALVLVLVAALPVTSALTGQLGQVTLAKAESVAGVLVVVLVVGAVGLVVARHQPGNPIGWLLLGAATWIPLTVVAGSYTAFVYHSGHYGIPVVAPVALILAQLFILVIVVFPVVTLVFPDGRLPAAGWRWVLGSYLLLCLTFPVSTLAAIAGHHPHTDASGSLSPADSPPSWLALMFFGAVVLAWLGALGHQLASWRSSSGERREQLKWLLAGTVVCLLLGTFALATNSAIWEVAIVGLAALPVGIGVGILKYRLYDIDRIISRTLAYTVVTGLLVGVYAGLVLLATEVLRFSSPVAVAAATLVAVALFNPLRRRVQAGVDHRFNRAHYDAEQTVAVFSARLKDAVDLDAVRADLLAEVRRSLEPAHLTVWLTDAGPAGDAPQAGPARGRPG